MDSELLIALKVSGIGILVLLAVLAAFAGIVSLLTRFVKDKPEEEEEGEEEEGEEAAEVETVESDLGKVAAIAVALARAQSVFTAAAQPSKSEFNTWGQFHLNRRLNSNVSFRRTK